MTKFDAGSYEPIEYDFTRFVPDAKGVVPEPSTKQLEAFTSLVLDIFPFVMDESGQAKIDAELFTKRFEEAGDDTEVLENRMNTGIADLCSNSPTAEQIAALPARIKQGFYGWIFGTFLSPEA